MTPREEELVTTHLPLVHSLAHKLAPHLGRGVEHDELVSAGHEGLIQAARRYDPERGVAFSTFAYYRIRGAMFDSVRRAHTALPTGRKPSFAERADEYLEPHASDPPPPDAAAAAERLATLVADLATTYVLCARDVNEEPDTTMPDPCEATSAREELSIVKQRLARLPDSEQRLLRLMYFEDLSMQDAAARLGMSKGWASRLHARALAKLRKETLGPAPSTAVRV
jgi:RNA polymerase sigma factor for flagellar operon FliA